MRQAAGLLASAAIVGAVIVACRQSGDVGYVEIKTVPAASVFRLRFISIQGSLLRSGKEPPCLDNTSAR